MFVSRSTLTNFTTILTAKILVSSQRAERIIKTDGNEERLPNYAALYTKRWETNERGKKKRGDSNACANFF